MVDLSGVKKTTASEEAVEKARSLGLKLTSAYRSPEHNAKIGGSKTSAHVKGLAYDFAGRRDMMFQLAEWGKKTGNYKQVIFNNKDYMTGRYIADHQDHVHISWEEGGSYTAPEKGIVQSGNMGEIVKAIQKLLGINSDGYFGDKTEQAVKNFQSNNELVVDGVVGNDTWNELSGKSLFFFDNRSIGGSEDIQVQAENKEGGDLSYKTDFFQKMKGYSQQAGTSLNIPYEVILAQWSEESDYGRSDLSKRANNFAGIKYTSNADFKSGAYSGYNSIDSFMKDYVRVFNLSYYKGVRDAGSISETAKALGDSPWAENPAYGNNILKIIKDNNLASIEGDAPATGFNPGNVLGTIGNGIGTVFANPLILAGAGLFYVFWKR